MTMTAESKREFIKHFVDLLDGMIEIQEASSTKTTESSAPELLTIRECAQAVTGLTEHAVRQLVAQGKIKHIRVGEDGKRGKILIYKAALLEYLKITA